MAAMDPLAELLTRRGADDEALEWRRRAAALRSPPPSVGVAAAGDVAVIVSTAVVTTALVPFAQTIVTKAVEDTYAGVRVFLSGLFAKHRPSGERSDPRTRNKLLIIKDPDPRLTLAMHLWSDTPDGAIRALKDLDLDALTGGDKPRSLFWNQARGDWQVHTNPEEEADA
ncbi:hypothetical protein [Streptomyces sp. NPDC055134]